MSAVAVPDYLPRHWQRVQMKWLVRFRNGTDYRDIEDDDGTVPVYGSGGEFARAVEHLYEGESVLFGRKGTVDRPMHVKGRFWTVDTMYFTELGPKVNGRFLYYFATTIPYGLLSTSTALPSMTQATLGQVEVPLPPMSEQRAIADFLDRETAQIDAMVDAQERLVALLEERRSSLVDELLLRPNESSRAATTLPWLPYIPADVQLIALKRLLIGIDQGVSPQANSNPAGPGEWGVLTAGCVNGGQFSDQKQKRLDDDFVVNPRHIVHVGDLIVSRASGSRKLVGSTGMVEQKRFNLILSDKTFRLRVRRGTSERFLYWFMNSNIYRHQVEDAISGAEGLANNLPLSALRNFRVVLPRPDEQARIARHLDRDVSKIDAMVAKAQESIGLMKERRAALISAAVTGRVDVRAGVEHVERELEEAMA